MQPKHMGKVVTAWKSNDAIAMGLLCWSFLLWRSPSFFSVSLLSADPFFQIRRVAFAARLFVKKQRLKIRFDDCIHTVCACIMTILEYRNIFKMKRANLDERLFDKLPGANLDYPASFFWLHREHREALSRKLDAQHLLRLL